MGAIEPRSRASARLRLEVAVVDLRERRELRFLEREALDDPHAGEARLHAIAHLADRCLIAPREREHGPREAAGAQDERGERAQRGQRELGRDGSAMESALGMANAVLHKLRTTNPSSILTCKRSLVARLMISPLGILR